MTPKPALLKILDYLSVIVLAISTYLALVYAPKELVMGEVQRVFYFHIGTAWTGLLGFVFAAGLGIAYLVTKDMKWDIVEVAAVEISVVFFFLTIVLGAIWARPAWNTWWTWDPRLTTAAVTELIYVAYFMLRAGIEDPERRARFGAVYALLGGLSAPITFMAIRLFRSIHPVIIGSANANQEKMSMSPDMRVAFFFALFAFTVIFVDLFWNRIRLGQLENKVEQLKLKVM
ncbi:MAG: cytochrome c-type biogenesis heme exporter protein C [Anaerolineaceae bacterium]|nr:cytochrome C assembly protein [Anaerolineae bacterium]MBL1173269.1 cytochrome C assembly protein [Chloroflexota bacterium]MCE7905778.1 cytochrome C assembly protein [Anaerolineae bacterium CFX3]MCL4823074.1 cytochrome c biogenesis protein CcsA [Anaerolineales bacterium]MDL1924745.1 cytochrome C assembly protein [Anaerolineae bacterium AMX1]GJQ38323.1 MAG: cytochrome c-type biogenesis heme exporter protein C [Anaerolineaceae bacterium]